MKKKKKKERENKRWPSWSPKVVLCLLRPILGKNKRGFVSHPWCRFAFSSLDSVPLPCLFLRSRSGVSERHGGCLFPFPSAMAAVSFLGMASCRLHAFIRSTGLPFPPRPSCVAAVFSLPSLRMTVVSSPVSLFFSLMPYTVVTMLSLMVCLGCHAGGEDHLLSDERSRPCDIALGCWGVLRAFSVPPCTP